MAFCNPVSLLRRVKTFLSGAARGIGFFVGFFGCLAAFTAPASAQGLLLLRDTETERALRSYEDPLLRAGGVDPAGVHIYLVNDPTVNSFVAEGQNMFIQTGMIMFAKNALELIGVMAHETGHIVAGHLSRDTAAMKKATIPMLLSMVIGIAAIAAGAGQAGMLDPARWPRRGAGAVQRVQPGAGIHRRPDRDQAARQDRTSRRADCWRRSNVSPTKKRWRPIASTRSPSTIPWDGIALRISRRGRGLALQGRSGRSGSRAPVRNGAGQARRLHRTDAGHVQSLSREPTRSKPARYARAMAYLRKPDLPKALLEINSLIKDEPNNPYFYEVLGQIYVSMAKPLLGVAAYQKSVDLMPNAPQLRVGLAAAQLATERPDLANPALANLKVALQQEDDDSFTWYEAAQAYSMMRNEPMADLATAERYYNAGAMLQAAQFATRARHGLAQGSPDWQRANDIVSWPCPRCAPNNTDHQGKFNEQSEQARPPERARRCCIAVTLMLAVATLGLLPQRLDGTQIRSYLLGHPELLVEMQLKARGKGRRRHGARTTRRNGCHQPEGVLRSQDRISSPARPMRNKRWSNSLTTIAPIAALRCRR